MSSESEEENETTFEDESNSESDSDEEGEDFEVAQVEETVAWAVLYSLKVEELKAVAKQKFTQKEESACELAGDKEYSSGSFCYFFECISWRRRM